MDAIVSGQELSVTVLCRLSNKLEHFIIAIDAVADDEKLTVQFVRSRLIQKERRNLTQYKSADKNSDLSMLVRRS